MKTLKVLFVALYLSLAVASYGFSESISIVTGEWPPFVSKTLPGGGLYTKIITAAFKTEGIDVEYKYVPWKRAVSEIKNGQSIAGYPFVYTDERAGFSEKAEPLGKGVDVFVFLKDKMPGFDYKNLEQLKPYNVAGLAGYSHTKEFQEAGLNVDVSPNLDTALKKLVLHRIDLICENEFVVKKRIKDLFPNKVNDFGFSSHPYYEDNMYLLFSKKHKDTPIYIKKFNAGLSKIKASGEYEKIMNEE